jgi:hypothetical protein
LITDLNLGSNDNRKARIQSAPGAENQLTAPKESLAVESTVGKTSVTGKKLCSITDPESKTIKDHRKRLLTDSGSGSPRRAGSGFPSDYLNVRKQREKANPFTVLPTVEGNRRKMAECVRSLPGFDLPNDDRQHGVSNYHVPALKKNVSSSVRRDDGGTFCVTCGEEHEFNDNVPFVVFLTDQNFPPSLPSDEQRCCVVIRLEDCLLSELPGVLKEFFGNRTGYLPEGSVLYFGSLSHLSLRGLETYAEEVVKMFKVFTNMLTGGCSVAHTVHFPLGGIRSEGLVRDMYDLDAWLRSGIVGSILSLPLTREKFWQIVRIESERMAAASTAERTLFLPEAINNSHKIRTVSGSVEGVLPATLAPLSEEGEKKLVESLMAEINDRHAINVNVNPHLDRCSGDFVFCENTGIGTGTRIIAIGASHITRIIGGLAGCGLDVINLAKPGWVMNENTAAEVKIKMRNLNVTASDILLVDPLANSVFCGTDAEGNHSDAIKNEGGWHIEGELNIRTKSYLKNVLSHLKKITDSFPDCKIVMLSPIPRYMHTKCCPDPEHIKNFGERTFQDEMSEDLDKVSDLLTAWLEATDIPSLLVDYRAGTEQPTVPVPDLTVDGQSIWQQSDPVHPNPALYAKLAELIYTSLDELDANVASGAPKRARLESVVVRKKASEVKTNPSKQSWSLGVLPPAGPIQPYGSRGRGGLRGRRGGRRGRFWRGNRVRGQWAPRGMF